MPGFDRTGPMGTGPMTGGMRGRCNPSGDSFVRGGFGPSYGRSRGHGRGYRHMFWATGFPGRKRSRAFGSWGVPFSMPHTKEQEVGFLKDRATVLKEELDAIDNRLQDIELEEK